MKTKLQSVFVKSVQYLLNPYILFLILIASNLLSPKWAIVIQNLCISIFPFMVIRTILYNPTLGHIFHHFLIWCFTTCGYLTVHSIEASRASADMKVFYFYADFLILFFIFIGGLLMLYYVKILNTDKDQNRTKSFMHPPVEMNTAKGYLN